MKNIKRDKILVAGLGALIILMVVFLFKTVTMELPSAEANNFKSKVIQTKDSKKTQNKEVVNTITTEAISPEVTPATTEIPVVSVEANSSPTAKVAGIKAYTLKEIEAAGTNILINKHFMLPMNYKTKNLVSLKGVMPLQLSYLQIIKVAFNPLVEMNRAAKADGVKLIAANAWRSYATQKRGFNVKVNEYLAKHKSRAEAEKLASRVVAPPNASEHQTGFAIDIVSTKYATRDEGFALTAAGKWLAKNSWKYGFILRYQQAKTQITEIIYEPWHFRYIGKEIAKKIYDQKICLEEYLKNAHS
ncbi:MAG: M15 family metallopeptidase [Bacillota bacterium]